MLDDGTYSIGSMYGIFTQFYPHLVDFDGNWGYFTLCGGLWAPTGVSMEVIVTIVSKLVYFTYLWDLSTQLL